MRSFIAPRRLAALAVGVVLVAGCGRSREIALPKPPQGEQPGTAVVILVDTSGSMERPVRDRDGKQRAKHEIAREALERIVENTAKWRREHPDRHLEVAVYAFATTPNETLAIAPFDEAKMREAVKKIPRPEGGTGIGRAMEEASKALYKSGRQRKFIICITDGENTTGPTPEDVARQLHDQTQGAVEIHFVAFDTSAKQFKFLKDVNGHVVEAANGEQLEKELTGIYGRRILAEAEEPEAK